MEGEEEGDENTAANSEIRYITLELMKLAQKSGRSFKQVADEYLQNAEDLQKLIVGDEAQHPNKKGAFTKEK